MTGTMWTYNLRADDSVTITPHINLRIVNAALATFPDGCDEARGVLKLSYYEAGRNVTTTEAVFRIPEAMQKTCMKLVLDANRTYKFKAEGPFQVDLIGYYETEEFLRTQAIFDQLKREGKLEPEYLRGLIARRGIV